MKKLTLDGVSAAPKKSTGKAKLILNVDEVCATLLGQWSQVNPQFKALKARDEALKSQMSPLIKRAFFSQFAGVGVPDETLVVPVGERNVKMIVKNRYTTTQSDESAIIAAIGKANTDKHFRFATQLNIDMTVLPDAVAEKFAARVIAIAKEENAMQAVSAKECIQPRAGFHEARTTILTPEENQRLDGVLAITAYPLL